MTIQKPTGPLAGIRILDMTAVVLGPVATQILGDYGADVIKIEPLEGDLMRANGAHKADGSTAGLSSIFLTINRNKRSLSVDLKSEEGRAAVRKLAATVDVFVHNMRIEAIERRGLGYAAVREIRPVIVYCVATGFDQDGPDRARPAFDDVIQAASGMVAISNVYAERPDFVSSLIADKTTGLALVNSVLAALFHRERSGQGQYVETPMLETMTAFVLAEHMGGMTFEPQEGPALRRRPLGERGFGAHPGLERDAVEAPLALERPFQERRDALVDFFAQLGDLALRYAALAHGLDQLFDLAGRDAGDPGLLHDGAQGLLDHPPRLKKGREIGGSRSQLGDLQVQRSQPRLQAALAKTVAVSLPIGAAFVARDAHQVLNVVFHEPLKRGLGHKPQKITLVALLQNSQNVHAVIGHRGFRLLIVGVSQHNLEPIGSDDQPLRSKPTPIRPG